MKKIITPLLIGAFVSLSFYGKSQTKFWTESWSGSAGSGGTTYTGPNGAWSVVQTGYNGVDSNAWYFSVSEEGMGRGQCGQAGSPMCAHVGFTGNAPFYVTLLSSPPDQGALVDDYNNTIDGNSTRTNLRLESPVINCSAASGGITLSFNYILGKAGGHDSATLWYYDGTHPWARLKTPPELDSCSSGQGLWTYYSVVLPTSANNNPNVQVGFNWTNDTTGYDDNNVPTVSFAIDSIVLSAATITTVMTLNDYNNSEIYPNPNKGMFTLKFENIIPNSSIEIYNVLGEKIYQAALNSSDENQISLKNPANGVYLYRVFSSDRTISSEGKFIVK